ncbi:MAG TPA: GAP family protein [Thermoleophilaceae bacterium]|nr:GAP family protein [Thermoleophilaceae bacterium]
MTSVLPLAITMMAGPQIMSAIIFITGERDPVKVSLAFVLGVAIAATLGISIAIGLAGLLGDTLGTDNSSEPSTTARVLELALVGLLIVASIKTYLGRETAEPPKWLGRLQGADAKQALKIGLLVILLMPSDVVIMLTAGVHLVSRDLGVAEALPLIGMTTLIAALPALAYLLFRKRARVAMPKVRTWMNEKSWLVNILVYMLFIVLILA